MNSSASSQLREPADVLYRIKRGLSGYVSYLAACEMNPAFSEYVLYEPILRILTARHYAVKSEVECPGIAQPQRGDKKRLDFLAKHRAFEFALEVKWAKTGKLNVRNDYAKLLAFLNGASPRDRAFLCVFGRASAIERVVLTPNVFEERGQPVIADFGRTRFGCRVFEPTV